MNKQSNKVPVYSIWFGAWLHRTTEDAHVLLALASVSGWTTPKKLTNKCWHKLAATGCWKACTKQTRQNRSTFTHNDVTIPYHITPYHSTHTISEHSIPHHTIPYHTTHTTPGQARPDQTRPDQTRPNQDSSAVNNDRAELSFTLSVFTD